MKTMEDVGRLGCLTSFIAPSRALQYSASQHSWAVTPPESS